MTWPRLHPSMQCPCSSCAGDRVHLRRELRRKLQQPRLNGEVLLTAPLVELLRTELLNQSPFTFSSNHIQVHNGEWTLYVDKYSGFLRLENKERHGFTHTIPVRDDAAMVNEAAAWAEETLKNVGSNL